MISLITEIECDNSCCDEVIRIHHEKDDIPSDEFVKDMAENRNWIIFEDWRAYCHRCKDLESTKKIIAKNYRGNHE